MNEERGPIPPAIPGEDTKEIKYGFQERKLRRLADASAKLFNEINYERRQQFFHGGKVDLKGTYDEYYGKYRGELGYESRGV
ncbi:MAG: hypothetical protein RXO28_04710 [Thermocladium sp.]